MVQKINRTMTIFAVVAIVSVFSLSSCQLFKVGQEGIDSKGEPLEEMEATESAEEEQESFNEIVIWESTDPKIRLKLTEDIEEFLNDNPDIDIEVRHVRSQEELLDEFRASSLAGSGPDIIISDFDPVKEIAPENVAKPLEEEFDFENIIEGLKEISEYEGSWYILPFRVTEFMMFFYNKQAVTVIPEDFEGVIEHSLEVYDPENQLYGFLLDSAEPDWVIPFVGGYGEWIVDYYNDSVTLDTQAMRDTIDFLLYIHDELEAFPYPVEYEDMDLLFKSGNAHMIINGLWALQEYKEEGIDFGIVPIPEVYDGNKNPTPMIDGLGFMININCYDDKLEAAKRFIGYMLQEDRQVSWIESTNTFPVLNDLDNNNVLLQDRYNYHAYKQSKLCRGKPRDELLRVIRDSLRVNLESVLKGNISVEEVIGKIQEDALNLRNGSINVDELNAEEI